jgi:superfamily II DNA or RNA helicase
LAERVDRAELVGDIVSHWHRLADRRKTVVFATNVAHSIHLAEEFAKSGTKAAHIDGSTPKDERDQILQRLSGGEIEIVVNCMVLTEGWDQPDVGCIVLARPTKSMGLYRQMVGRGLRPFAGKDHCLVLDHAGATLHHGFVEDPVRWFLAEDKRVESPAQIERRHWCPSGKKLAVQDAGSPTAAQHHAA